ncbi:MAG: plasmid partition protein ParG [Acidobacteriota bacterium]
MKRLSMNIPENLHKKLKRYCVDVDKDMTDVVLKLVEEFLTKEEKKRK